MEAIQRHSATTHRIKVAFPVGDGSPKFIKRFSTFGIKNPLAKCRLHGGLLRSEPTDLYGFSHQRIIYVDVGPHNDASCV